MKQKGTNVYGKGKNTLMDENVRIAISDIIATYKKDFSVRDEEEHYKWEALGWYKDHWNIEADDFGAMIKESFSKCDNLLDAKMYYPYGMLCRYAADFPDEARASFRMLYDESVSLDKRYKTFRKNFDTYIGRLLTSEPNRSKSLRHYQDLHAVSVYLSFEFPENYYIYKYSIFKKFKELAGYEEDKTQEKSDVWKLISYNQLCDMVRAELIKDKELLKMSSDRLDASCYKDEQYHLLTMDVVYFGKRYEEFFMSAGKKRAERIGENMNFDIGKNTILYGPPGTGKTYSTVLYAVAIIEKKKLSEVTKEKYEAVLERYKRYKEQGLIETTTFHQSYGYEEFMEGLKPVINKQNQNLEYTIEDGVFKKFCNSAVCFEKEFDFDEAWELLLKRVNQNKEYVFTRRTGNRLKAILKNKETFRVEWSGGTFNDLTKSKTREQYNTCSYADRDKLSGGNKWLFEARQAIIDELEMLFEQENNSALNSGNYVFIIDEINRGNISKIFGELITLIESAKRLGQPEGMTVRLPYSQKLFGVPENVYLLGTMNTADRSIATIDTALRRRFQFKEMQPNPEVLDGVFVEDLNVSEMLSRMNRKISVLYDREHTIGHAYFMPLIKEPTIEVLSGIFENNIIPLLQEYFYDDYEKIRLILGDVNKEDEEEQFIIARQNDLDGLFGNVDCDFEEDISYEINPNAFDNIESYRSI